MIEDMRVLLCPCHYIFDEVSEGTEFSWAFHIGDRIARRLAGSVVVTGAARLHRPKPYRVIQLEPTFERKDFFSARSAVRFNWKYATRTANMVRHGSFDIVHHVLPFALGTTYNLSWLVGLRADRPRLVLGPVQAPLEVGDDDLGSVAVTRPIRWMVGPLLAQLSGNTVRRADRIIAVDERAKTLLVAAGASPDHVVVISPGIDASRFEPAEVNANRSVRFEVLAVGHLVKRKGIDTTIRAVGELIRSKYDVHLTVVGDGPQRIPLQKLASSEGLDVQVDFVGAVANSLMPQYYRKAHVLVSMSLSESFGVVCLEAMASGLPIVATKVGVFAETISPGRNGFLVSPNDYRRLAAMIGKLSANRAVLTPLGLSARQDAVTKFDWDQAIIPRYLELYDDLVGPKRRSKDRLSSS